jgi:uncharacterized protein YodC (DUF2158 family)
MRIGDVVYLKSGGPAMTIYSSTIAEDRVRVLCKWFSGQSVYEELFHIDMLTTEKPPSSLPKPHPPKDTSKGVPCLNKKCKNEASWPSNYCRGCGHERSYIG